MPFAFHSLVILITVMLCGCVSYSPGGQYSIDGDLLEGTTRDTSGLIDVKDFQNLNGYRLNDAAGFIESVNQVEKTEKAAEEKGGDTPEKKNPETNFSFAREGDTYVYRDRRPEVKDAPFFVFREKAGRLVLAMGPEIEALHYSVKENGEAFSMLLRFRTKSATILTAFTFNKIKAQVPIRHVPSKYNYFTKGEGDAIPWKRPIHINVCGKNAAAHKAEVEASLARWSTAAGFKEGFIGSEPYIVSVATRPRPFSDLNQNCVYFDENRIARNQNGFVAHGMTMPVIDPFDREIINASIFVFLKSNGRIHVGTVLDHEMGHLLGLDHTAVWSIMSYGNSQTITHADREALLNLYGENRPSCTPAPGQTNCVLPVRAGSP